MLILKAANNGRTDVADIIEQCHPLGRFDANTMRSIASFENTPEGHSELYRTVLVETPIGKYFERYLIETKEDAKRQNAEERQQILNDEVKSFFKSFLNLFKPIIFVIIFDIIYLRNHILTPEFFIFL